MKKDKAQPKKAKTLADILADPRIERVIKNYDGHGKHMVECKDGYRFEGERTVDVGTIAELCYEVNERLEPFGPEETPQPKEPILRTKVGTEYSASGYGRGVNKRNVYIINGYYYAYHPQYADQAFTPCEGDLKGYVRVNKSSSGTFYAVNESEHTHVSVTPQPKKGDNVIIRLFTYKSKRHYGGREIDTTPHICKAVFEEAQSDHTFVVILSEDCAGYKAGHKIAVQPKDFNLPEETPQPVAKHTEGEIKQGKTKQFSHPGHSHCYYEIDIFVGESKVCTVSSHDAIQAEANAAELVKRWNLFPELVAFLEELDFENEYEKKSLREKGDSLLKKAKGE